MLETFHFVIDGEKVSARSNTLKGAAHVACLSWNYRYGRSPKSVQCVGVGAP